MPQVLQPLYCRVRHVCAGNTESGVRAIIKHAGEDLLGQEPNRLQIGSIGAAIRLTMTSRLISGLPRQFCVMREKRRCSILFHLLVPGGKWQTAMLSALASANFCSSSFHNRTREPLLPPPSAVISRLVAFGYACCPIDRHQRRMLSTANSAVSWSTPTLTQPVLRPMS